MNAASTAVPTQTFIGSPLTDFRIFLMIGSKRPASIMTPKKRMAKQIMMPVGATFFTPSNIILPSLASWKPSPTAKMIGISTRAFIAVMRLDMMRYMNRVIIANPA